MVLPHPSSLGGMVQPNFKPNAHVVAFIDRAKAEVAQVTTNEHDASNARTELDSHANMVVVGHHAYILNTSGWTVQVSPFTPEYEALKEVPIVDAAVAYDCPYTNKTYILVFHNALSVPSMDHNLVPLSF